MHLPNGCYSSELTVHPGNWNTTRASTKKDWYIGYRFYDPSLKDHEKLKSVKQVILKGMNKYKELELRQAATEKLLETELFMLLQEGFNPITREFNPPPVEIAGSIEPITPFIAALKSVKKKIDCSKTMERDLRTLLPHVETAARDLKIQTLRISQVRRRHIKLLLEKMEEQAKWKSAHRYNKNRSSLMILFSELVELEAVEFNPVREIRKKRSIQRLREVMTPEERIKVKEHLKNNHPEFYRFTQIFFHSGARLTEMVGLQGKKVDLKKQTFIVLIKKGRVYREVRKTIKDIALPYWQQTMASCGPEDFVFSKSLKPGPIKINTDQITKRWKLHVKRKLGIQKDFYSLKHLNTDEIAASAGIENAAAMNSHTTPVITLKHYAVGEEERQRTRLRGLNNEL